MCLVEIYQFNLLRSKEGRRLEAFEFKANKFAITEVETIEEDGLEFKSFKIWNRAAFSLLKNTGVDVTVLIVTLDVIKFTADFVIINVVWLKPEELANLLALCFVLRICDVKIASVHIERFIEVGIL